MADNTLHRIKPDSYVTMHYRIRLREPDRTLIDTFDGNPATFQLGIGQLAEPLERCLVGLEDGCASRLELAPGRAFGPRNPNLMTWVPNGLMRDARWSRGSVQGPAAPQTGAACGSTHVGGHGDEPPDHGAGRGPTAQPVLMHGEVLWQIGDTIELPGPDGRSLTGIVRDKSEDAYLLDFNHPLAGQGIVFEVRIMSVL